MSLLYQHEIHLLLDMAVHCERKAAECETKAHRPGANEKMYLRQKDKELTKAKVLRKAAS